MKEMQAETLMVKEQAQAKKIMVTGPREPDIGNYLSLFGVVLVFIGVLILLAFAVIDTTVKSSGTEVHNIGLLYR